MPAGLPVLHRWHLNSFVLSALQATGAHGFAAVQAGPPQNVPLVFVAPPQPLAKPVFGRATRHLLACSCSWGLSTGVLQL